MSATVVDLYVLALETAALLALPALAVIAGVGVVVGLAQTLVGIQDQNLSFGPKIGAVILLAGIFGLPALTSLSWLLRAAIDTLPRLNH